MTPPRARGQRAGLDRETVLAAARDLLARDGLDALTMRALADRLGVRPNTLYSHVPSKTALVDELLDDVLGGIPAPEDPRPEQGVRELMTATYRVLLEHAELVPLYLSRQGARGPQAQRLGEIMLDLLAKGGVHGEQAVEARRVLIVYTIGFAAFNPGEGAVVPQEHIARNFALGLDWLLTGILGAGMDLPPPPA
ncbi:helix-turn-helix domain-containing protein [Nonomuraea sp. NPDC050310]|uniref:TetR/AcrR family transcriptional regulator n=1 Tax=unclassified Nonomuraea TaxID=2593643 RepID=UPI003405DA28